MTPKEKANELMLKSYDLDEHNKTTQIRCKQIALLCLDEIIENEKKYYGNREMLYWEEVKQEIEKK
jgi:Pyruvate/2-oxoacid:ferredoxin oxidoreductase delta subunit